MFTHIDDDIISFNFFIRRLKQPVNYRLKRLGGNADNGYKMVQGLYPPGILFLYYIFDYIHRGFNIRVTYGSNTTLDMDIACCFIC